MDSYSFYSDFIKDKTGSYRFEVVSDSEGFHTSYDFDSEDGASTIQGEGTSLEEALDDTVNKVLEWEKDNKEDKDTLLSDLSEELTSIIMDQQETIDYYEDIIDSLNETIDNLTEDFEKASERINYLEEVIDDKNIEIKQLQDKIFAEVDRAATKVNDKFKKTYKEQSLFDLLFL